MNDKGLVTCQSCGAKFDRDYGRCWKCGVRETEKDSGSTNVKNPYVEEFSKSNYTVQNILLLAAAFILLGACSTAPGLAVVVVIGFVIYFATSRKGKAESKSATEQPEEREPGERGHATGLEGFSRRSIHVLFKMLAALILLPICFSIGAFIICGGFASFVGLFSVNQPYMAEMVLVLIPMVGIAIPLFWMTSRALGSVLKS